MTGYTNQNVLVTGGAGFIGSHLVEELVRQGAQVSVIDNLSSGTLSNLSEVNDRVQVHQQDMSRENLNRVMSQTSFDVIFHLAGHVDIPASVKNPRWDLEMNGINTFNLLEEMRMTSSKARVLFASSAAVYGESAGKPFREDDPTFPIAPYGVSKLTSERYMAIYPHLYELRTASLRLFPVYGPRLCQHVVYDLIYKAHENSEELFIYGDGTQVRDFNYVSNAVDAFLLVAEKAPLKGEVYNVAFGNPVPIKNLAMVICEQIGIKPSFVYSGDVGSGVSKRWDADVSRLLSLGYKPQVKLVDGVANTVNWFCQNIRKTKTN